MHVQDEKAIEKNSPNSSLHEVAPRLARQRVARHVEEVGAQAELRSPADRRSAVVQVVIEDQQRALGRRRMRHRLAVVVQEERVPALERLAAFTLEAFAF